MNDAATPGRRAPLSSAERAAVALLASGVVTFSTYGALTGAPSLAGYLAIVVGGLALLVWLRRSPLPDALAIGLSLVALGHLAGGLIRVGDDVLYNASPGIALLSLYGAAGVVCGLAPKDLPGVATTPASRVHVAATIVGGVAVLGCMALAVAQEPSGAWRRTTLALFLATIVAAVTFRQAWGTSIYGALERVVLGVPMLWVTALAARALDGIARRNTGVELTRG
jgi:hypothetical protein